MKNIINENIGDCIVDIFNTLDNKTVNIKQDSDMIVLTHAEAIRLFELIKNNISL